MKAKAIDGLQFVVALGLAAAGANKVPGADVLVRQLDLIGPALIGWLGRTVRAALTTMQCFLGAQSGAAAVLAVSIMVGATMAESSRPSLNLLAMLCLLALGEAAVWARLRWLARDPGGAPTVAHRPCSC